MRMGETPVNPWYEQDPDIPRFLTTELARRAIDETFSAAKGGGLVEVYLRSAWIGRARWARNRIHSAEESTESNLSVIRILNGAVGTAFTNRFDAQGIRDVVADAEFALRYMPESVEPFDREPPLKFIPHLTPDIWSEATLSQQAETRGNTSRSLIQPAESKSFLCAGEIMTGSRGHSYATSNGEFRYYPETFVQCSLTIRDGKTRASGWAGRDDHDWARIDFATLGQRALDKCEQSRNPKAVEPGRYTTVLEPQAVHDLFNEVWSMLSQRADAESGRYPFRGEQQGVSKINEMMFDSHLTLNADPMDPEAGFVPFNEGGEPYHPAEWVKSGQLRQLPYGRIYGIRYLRIDNGLPSRGAYRWSSDLPPVSIEEMVRTTRRGIYVTRLSDVTLIDRDSGLSSGFTRDGTWLIENGKITYPIKNFRFLDSPIFAFNNIDQIGKSVRVYSPNWPVMAPAMKVRDFNFASLVDAI